VTIDLTDFLPAAVLVALLWLPVLVAVVIVLVLKRIEARDDRRSPLADKLLHQPGSQARKKAEDIGDEIMSRLTFLFLAGPLCMMAILLPRVQWAKLAMAWVDYAVILLAVASTIWALRGIVTLRRERRNWLNGMRGEMASAQALDRLRAQGCEVFHDLPGDRGNIDHVVVTPNAVYAVETKWRSKRGQGAVSAEAWFDGKMLQFPGFSDTAAIEQARACAAELSKFLTGRTGEPVRVVPVVALPGWFVKNRREASTSEAMAINPKMGGTLLNHPGTPMQQAQRNRIANAIADRYPDLDPG
jgi:hypothetical protein